MQIAPPVAKIDDRIPRTSGNSLDFATHPDITVQKLSLGREGEPLLLIDNLLADAEALVDQAARKHYGDVVTYYPGVRAKAPLLFQMRSNSKPLGWPAAASSFLASATLNLKYLPLGPNSFSSSGSM